MPDDPSGTSLTEEQAFEAAYRFVAQYYKRERIEPFFLMLHSMGWEGTHPTTRDPATWDDWRHCVQLTLSGQPLPDLPSPR